MYKVASELSLLSSGVYSADLGTDLQDAPLAPKAFGPNGMHLARLKHSLDPQSMLAHTCPLPSPPREPKLIVFITGDCENHVEHTQLSRERRNVKAAILGVVCGGLGKLPRAGN